MSCLSSVESELPPGFRFHPKDEELICDYLMKMVIGCPRQSPLLVAVDLNKCEPWDIPQSACVGGKEWYFYSLRDRKYATGLRTNRATVSGYWKATGKDRAVIRKGTLVGMRKTLVFYQGRAPKGKKTCWVMHEFRLEESIGPGPKMGSPVKEDWVLCRVFYKNSSEMHTMKQETDTCRDNEPSSPPSLPTLLESQIKFNQITNQSYTNDLYSQQVPCFSMYNTNLTNPCMPRVIHMDPPQNINNISNFGYLDNEPDDQKVIKTVLNQLTMKESPSFGEGGIDNYFSEVGLSSSMWSNYL